MGHGERNYPVHGRIAAPVNLILLEPDEVDAAGDATLSDERATHALTVLHAAAGHSIRIGLVDGPAGIGTVTAVARRSLTMHCAFDEAVPTRPRVDLLLALPRPKVLRRLWAQLSALGVGRIILTNAERVERHYFDTHILEPDHYRPWLIEGLQQARDTRLPIVSIHRQFKVLIEDHLEAMVDDGPRVVADPSASATLDDVVRGEPTSRLLLAVGPEGGWNAFELDLLETRGFLTIGMGPRTLRSDTACVALITLAHRALTHK